jgi:1-acyl-sn-glycerol-3-phosphate acyltransferase
VLVHNEPSTFSKAAPVVAADKLSPRWIELWRPFRRRERIRKHRLLEVEVNGVENVKRALDQGCGVLITPNHSSHADCFALYEAADCVGCLFYVMVAWQVFHRSGWLRRLILRQHGCFSIDREGTDLSALRQAREVLQSGTHPLVIFPEGEVYHLNERTIPFREGPAAVALMAAKKASRPVVCVPCAMKYIYVEDPTPELLDLLDRLERAVFWRPRPDLTMGQRIYHLAEGLLSLKEVEFFGKTSSGLLPERIAALIEFILGRIEAANGLDPLNVPLPERIKVGRQHVIKRLEEIPDDHSDRKSLHDDLDDLFFVVQLYSYPGDYVSENVSVERIAETLDKLEEDVLGAKTATIRGARKATVTFGNPIPVETGRGRRTNAATLTETIETYVQAMLN